MAKEERDRVPGGRRAEGLQRMVDSERIYGNDNTLLLLRTSKVKMAPLPVWTSVAFGRAADSIKFNLGWHITVSKEDIKIRQFGSLTRVGLCVPPSYCSIHEPGNRECPAVLCHLIPTPLEMVMAVVETTAGGTTSLLFPSRSVCPATFGQSPQASP